MNFAQHWRTDGVEEVDYALHVPLSFVREMMEREHAGFVADCVAHPSDDPYEAAQRERGWPSAAEMLADAELLRMTAEHYGPELLLEWLGDVAPAEAPGYVLNTVRFHARAGDAVVLAGRARRADRPVRYQDA
jgi:hypothetical protein